MSARGISRRAFLKAAAVAGVAGSTAGLLAPFSLRADHRGRSAATDPLQIALETLLGDGVEGIEKRHHIAGRLAIDLAGMGGHPRGIVEARRQILLRAAEDVEQARLTRRDEGPRNVSRNLNDLLDAVRVVPVSSRLLNPLIGGMVATTLFATRGIHFDDTRAAQQQLRSANREMKNRRSLSPLEARLLMKKQQSIRYRRAIAERRRQVSYGGHFPEDIEIPSVWVMRRAKGAKRRRQ